MPKGDEMGTSQGAWIAQKFAGCLRHKEYIIRGYPVPLAGRINHIYRITDTRRSL
jgi:hypothetical protein